MAISPKFATERVLEKRKKQKKLKKETVGTSANSSETKLLEHTKDTIKSLKPQSVRSSFIKPPQKQKIISDKKTDADKLKKKSTKKSNKNRIPHYMQPIKNVRVQKYEMELALQKEQQEKEEKLKQKKLKMKRMAIQRLSVKNMGNGMISVKTNTAAFVNKTRKQSEKKTDSKQQLKKVTQSQTRKSKPHAFVFDDVKLKRLLEEDVTNISSQSIENSPSSPTIICKEKVC